jgi:hypothetical protein
VLIALAAVVLFAGSWFTVLRPKPVDDTAATPVPAQEAPKAPGQQGLENAVTKAKGAASTSQSSAKAREKAANEAGGTAAPSATGKAKAKTGASTTKSSKSAGTKPAGSTAAKPAVASDPSHKLLANLAHGRTVVLVFTQEGGADDRAARKAVRRLAAADKKVVTAVAPISKVGEYEAITTGVQVLTAPTVLVIGPDRHAVPVSGYTDVGTLKQVVGDVRRAANADKK